MVKGYFQQDRFTSLSRIHETVQQVWELGLWPLISSPLKSRLYKAVLMNF